jgi:hypothetical protein
MGASFRAEDDEVALLLDGLLRIMALWDRDSRDRVVLAVGRSLPEVTRLPRRDGAGDDLAGLVALCLAHRGGVQELVSSVRAMGVRGQLADQLAEVAEYVRPDELLTSSERRRLLGLLSSVPRSVLIGAFRRSAPAVATTPDGGAEALVTELEALIGMPDRLPPVLLFAQCLAESAESTVAAGCRALLNDVVHRLHLTPGPAGPTDPFSPEEMRTVLVVVVRPDAYRADRFRFSATLRIAGDPGVPLPGGDGPYDTGQLEIRFAATVAVAQGLATDVDGRMVVELVLPRSLITEPVDRWPGPDTDPVGARHVVVLRSLERLDDVRLHSAWQRRWRMVFEDSAAGLLHVQAGGGSALARLRAGDGTDRTTVLAVDHPLPAEPRPQDALSVALSAGVPIVVWVRDPDLRHAFRAAVETVVVDPLRELPERIAALRSDAQAGDSKLGAHLSLLWDDADHLPGHTGAWRFAAPV